MVVEVLEDTDEEEVGEVVGEEGPSVVVFCNDFCNCGRRLSKSLPNCVDNRWNKKFTSS